MRHPPTILVCAVALSAAACARTPTEPASPRFDVGNTMGSGNYSAPAPSFSASGIFFGGGGREETSTTTTSTTSTSDSTAVTGGGSGTGRGVYFGGGQ